MRRIYDLNPMVRFVGAFRDVLYDLRFPPLWRRRLPRRLWSVGAMVVGLCGVLASSTAGSPRSCDREPAIVVDDVSKRFRLYHERNQSLKAA